MKYIYLSIVVSIFFLSSCESAFYSKFERIPKSSWKATDTLYFDFDITETGTYSIYFQARHSKDYAFSNLWVKWQQDFPGIENDTTFMYQSSIADATSGKWIGECTPSYCTVISPVFENKNFTDIGKYKLSLIQYMRVDPLAEVSDIGIKVVKGVTP